MYSCNGITPHAAPAAKRTLILCVLTLALHGCASSAVRTSVALPPTPQTPGAVLTDSYLCIPHNEAAELLLWIEQAEARND